MSDNPIYPPTGLPIAADDVLGALHQIIKVAFGADGSVTQVDGSNPLPVATVLAALLTQADTALDANSTATVGTALTIDTRHRVALQVDISSGSAGTLVVELQVSADGVTWYSTTTTVTGAGIAQVEVFHKFVRAKVKTASGAAATITATVQAK